MKRWTTFALAGLLTLAPSTMLAAAANGSSPQKIEGATSEPDSTSTLSNFGVVPQLVGCPVETSHFTAVPSLPIPDPGTVTSTIVVSGADPYLWDLNLQTFLSHAASGDLQVTLTSPAGTIVSLTTDNGGAASDVFDGTVWDDQANPGGQVPYVSNDGLVTDATYVSGVVRSPLVPEEAMGAFVGEDPNGTWTLTVADVVPTAAGLLESWSLEVSTLPSAPPLTTVHFSSTGNQVIPTTPGVVSSTITVVGARPHLAWLTLDTFLQHRTNADLDVTLQSPAGTVATISTDNGDSFRDVFSGTTWDDRANPLGMVPYSSNDGLVTDQVYSTSVTATPLVFEEALAAFAGENPNGIWTITISVDTPGLGGDLDSWSLHLTTLRQCPPLCPQNCDDGNECTDDTCDPGIGCVNTPDDTNACGNGNTGCKPDHCVAGVCVTDIVDCDDGNPCTLDFCPPVGDCAHTNICCGDGMLETAEQCDPPGAASCPGGAACRVDCTCPPPPPSGCAPVPLGGAAGWFSRAPIDPGVEAAAGVIIGSRIYVTHGYSGLLGGDNTRTAIYDIPSDTWITGAEARVPRSALTGVCVEDASGQGLVFAVGGTTQPNDEVELYNPVTNTWSNGAPMPTPRGAIGAAFVPGTGVTGGQRGSVYVIGGRQFGGPQDGPQLSVNEAYDVANDNWVVKAPLPVSMTDVYSTTYFPATGKIYVIGGYDGTNPSSLVQIYDPVSNSWSLGAPMPTPRSNLLSGICGNKIYAIGGYDGVMSYDTNEAYDPLTNTWTPAALKPTPSAQSATQSIYTGGEIYAIGGGVFGDSESFHEMFRCGCVLDSDCNDGNPCTDDACDPTTSLCTATPNSDPCDDGQFCTTGDLCTAGTCRGTPYLPPACIDGNVCTDDQCDPDAGGGGGACSNPNNTAPCDDATVCNGREICSGGSCQPGTVLDCDDHLPCTDDSCDPEAGCVNANDDTNACTDGNACTLDTCASGICTSTAIACDDGRVCTDDTCDPGSGCVYTNDDTNACTDQNACTADTCSGGSCRSAPINCNDANACTVNGCDPTTGCTSTPLNCDDGSACTADACDPASGCSHLTIDCGDANKCTNDSCNPAMGCVNVPVSCNDGNACSTDACVPDSGCTHTAANCDDGNACTNDSCNPSSGCRNVPVVCDDGNACTSETCNPASGCSYTTISCFDGNSCTNDSCNPTTGCVNGTITCDDHNPCTDDSCSSTAGCVYTPNNGNACSDGNACTANRCLDGGCIPSTIVCDDHNSCTDDSCDPSSGCIVTNDNTNACSDGSACTNDACVSGSCVGTPITCNDGNPCTDDSCDPASGCASTNDNTNACSDGSACTNDACVSGSCVGTAITCNDANPCTDDTCNPASGCVYPSNNTNACSDGNACTVEACVGGSCASSGPVTCNDSNPCTDDSCAPATGCVFQNDNTNSCSDGNACTNDVCASGSCVSTGITCNDGNPCTDDSCNPATGCRATNDDTNSCSDGNDCTADACVSGTCVGTGGSCDDGNVCTTDSCSPTGCRHTPVPYPCDDGTVCTTHGGETSPPVFGGTITTSIAPNGDVTITFTESTDINDNSYGANRVNWPRNHNFSDLVGSDKAQFAFRDGGGNVVFEFFLDYLSQSNGTPSGYATLGVAGGEGDVVSGQESWLLDWSTSMASNLNDTGYCNAGSCTHAGTNLFVDSPPTMPPNTSYTTGPAFSQWFFPIRYRVTVSHLAFGGAGYGGVTIPYVHNSPPKRGRNATDFNPCPCEGTADEDGDGICDSNDNCLGQANPDQRDTDGDGLGDACDPCPADPVNDADGDGVCGNVDNCPLAPNTSQANSDGDGLGDACDPCPTDPSNDFDGDGVCDGADNCPAIPNPDQQDTDGDGIGDVCENACPDTDGDGISDCDDACPHSCLDPTVIIPPSCTTPPPPATAPGTALPCNTGVPNYLLPGGCTIADKIVACDAGSHNQSQFDKCVKALLNQLKKQGVITEAQRKAIDRCVRKYKKRSVGAPPPGPSGSGSSAADH